MFIFWESNLLSNNIDLAFPLGIQCKASHRYGCSFKSSLANCSVSAAVVVPVGIAVGVPRCFAGNVLPSFASTLAPPPPPASGAPHLLVCLFRICSFSSFASMIHAHMCPVGFPYLVLMICADVFSHFVLGCSSSRLFQAVFRPRLSPARLIRSAFLSICCPSCLLRLYTVCWNRLCFVLCMQSTVCL